MNSYPTPNDSADGYILDGKPVFGRTFHRAMSFHFPEELAAVQDETGAYHIDLQGKPRYAERYLATFGFYDGIATVRDERGWFHIRPDGTPLHSERFRWSGNFQEQHCVVLDCRGFYHIDMQGKDAHGQRYRYAGDFRSGIAVVHGPDGARHIRTDGSKLNAAVYCNAEPYHKGHAVVEDEAGFYHVDRAGRGIHTFRFQRAEPFYNGIALCRGEDGGMLRLRENGSWTRIADSVEPIDLDAIAGILKAGCRMGLFLRHAERFPITTDTPDWGNEVPLTPEGIEAAVQLGEAMPTGIPLGLWSSPLNRCKQTCEAIARGAGQAGIPIATHRNLGHPGIYFDGSGAHESPMKNDFHAFAEGFLERGKAPGMLPLSQTSDALLEFLEEGMASNTCTFFITHDFFAAVLMHYLGLKAPDRTDWCAYLEGVCLIADEGKMTFRHFHYQPR